MEQNSSEFPVLGAESTHEVIYSARPILTNSNLTPKRKVKGNSDPELLMVERLESLKAGIVGGLTLGLAFVITSFVNTLVLAKYFPTLTSLEHPVNWGWLVSSAIAGFSGLLFGVTYRYIIRQDQNPQLKAGGVLAFGLVRGLTQIETSWNFVDTVLPGVVLAGESILWFALAAITLDFALHQRWLKPFS